MHLLFVVWGSVSGQGTGSIWHPEDFPYWKVWYLFKRPKQSLRQCNTLHLYLFFITLYFAHSQIQWCCHLTLIRAALWSNFSSPPPCVAICFLTVLSFCVKSILNLKPSQAAVLDSTGWMKALFQTGKICYLNKANGLLEQQEKSSQKQVATFICGGYQNWMKNRFVVLNYTLNSFSTRFFC